MFKVTNYLEPDKARAAQRSFSELGAAAALSTIAPEAIRVFLEPRLAAITPFLAFTAAHLHVALLCEVEILRIVPLLGLIGLVGLVVFIFLVVVAVLSAQVTAAIGSRALPRIRVRRVPGPLAELGVLAAHDAAVAVVDGAADVVAEEVVFGDDRLHDAVAAAATALAVPSLAADPRPPAVLRLLAERLLPRAVHGEARVA